MLFFKQVRVLLLCVNEQIDPYCWMDQIEKLDIPVNGPFLGLLDDQQIDVAPLMHSGVSERTEQDDLFRTVFRY